MQSRHLNSKEYHIYTIEDIHELIDHNTNKDRKNKIFEELENVEANQEDQKLHKNAIKSYMKKKMLCFYNKNIVNEMFNLMRLDKDHLHRDHIEEKISKNDFCDYYIWLEEKSKERIAMFEESNTNLYDLYSQLSFDSSYKRNDYIYIVLQDFKTLFKNSGLCRWKGEGHEISQLYISFHHEQSPPDTNFIVYSMKDSRNINKFNSFELGHNKRVALRLDTNQITKLEVHFYKSYNPLKMKSNDCLIASAIIRLDTNQIQRYKGVERLQIELVETVDFHLEEELKAKAEIIEKYYDDIFDEHGNLRDHYQKYFELKHRTHVCCCCCEYRSSRDKNEYKNYKKHVHHEIKPFFMFSETFGPFSFHDLDEIKTFVEEYRRLKISYIDKQITNPEIMGTLNFELEVLPSEREFLEIKKHMIQQEIAHNNHEILYLKEKLLYLYKQWGTLGIIDSVNFYRNFSVCHRAFRIENEKTVTDSPLKSLEDIKNFQEIGSCMKETFIWIPRLILLLSILISYCRPDFLTVMTFLMITPFSRKRWKREHYYSALMSIFLIILMDVWWMVIQYEDWTRDWYPENWSIFVEMAWFLSLINTLIKCFYYIVLVILAITEHDKI